MNVKKVYVRCHLPGGAHTVRVMVSKKQLADMMSGDSSLWPILRLRVKEKLGLRGEFLVLFGNVILKQLRGGTFPERIVEIDLSDVPNIESEISASVSAWKRFWAAAVSVMFRLLKRATPSTNGT